MAPASNEEQFKFLISCIRYSNNGKVDFGQVAKECKIVSKGAAAKRYERMMRAHGIASNPATIKSAPSRSLKSELNGPVSPTTPSPTAKKRKAHPYLEENTADDDEGFGTVKAEPTVTIKEQLVVKEEEQQQPAQLSFGEAMNLMQYYDTPTQYAGIGVGIDDNYAGEYTFGSSMCKANVSGSSIGALYETGSQQPYGFSLRSSYGNSGMGGSYSSEAQRLPYQPLSRMQYSSDEQGQSDSPVIVE
ncbi:hypothetical protein BKA65DRAFT_545530 [Rhexocercosporidium sp. MPI-PUGE-AT-0058]|nr:hypothetical protein BKA65DRAFT_545530 [Rhexocercosporidium sp. MPI-PUGE-AT-0058]